MFTTGDLFGKFHSPRQPLQAARAQLPTSPNELANFFQRPFPAHWLSPTEAGPNSRERVYSLGRTFWTFLWQVLNPGSPCTEAVNKLIAWFASLGRPGVHPDTSPYCKARARLPKATLLDILQATAQRAEQGIRAFWRFHDRDVKVVDGTTLSAPDTKKNQRAFPQSASQKEGCGFPLIRLVGLFSLADRLFCDYVTIAWLGKGGVDSVLRLNEKRARDFRKGKRLGKYDRLVTWKKPERKRKTATRRIRDSLPEEITVRLIRYPGCTPGFRTKHIILATTLLDPVAYPAAEPAQLYLRRWSVELWFRHIKSTLQMDLLSCLSPAMLAREVMTKPRDAWKAAIRRSAHRKNQDA